MLRRIIAAYGVGGGCIWRRRGLRQTSTPLRERVRWRRSGNLGRRLWRIQPAKRYPNQSGAHRTSQPCLRLGILGAWCQLKTINNVRPSGA